MHSRTFGTHVGKEASDFGGKVNDMSRLVLFKDGLGVLAIPQVSIFGRQKYPCLAGFGMALFFHEVFDGLADETGASRHEDDRGSFCVSVAGHGDEFGMGLLARVNDGSHLSAVRCCSREIGSDSRASQT